MRTPPPELTRQLARVAGDVLGRGRSLRVDEVAAASGVPRATLYYYFSSRSELLAFLLTHELQGVAGELERAAAGPGPVEDRIVAVLGALLRVAAPQPEVCLALLVALAEEPVMRGHLVGARGTPLAPLRELVDEGVRSGVLHAPDLDIAVAGALGSVLLAAHTAGADAGRAAAPIAEQVVRGLRGPR